MSWWDASWFYRKKLTFDNSGQAENLASFPVLVKLTTANFDFSKALATGYDIRFVDADDTTELKYEREGWTANAEGWFWVKVPQIDASSSTDFIYIYYGNAAAGDGQDAVNVWDSNFKAVWHMRDDPDTSHIADSTVNNNDGTKAAAGAPAEVTAQIDKGQDFDGTDDYISLADSADWDLGAGDWTIDFWAKADLTANGIPLNVAYNSPLGSWGYAAILYTIRSDGGVNLHMSSAGNSWDILLAYAIAPAGTITTAWAHCELKRNGATVTFYKNGTSIGTASIGTASLFSTGTYGSLIGREAGGTLFPGLLDEIRFTKGLARSTKWLAADILSMTLAFITFGSEEENITAKTSFDTGAGVDVLVQAEVILQGTESGVGSDLPALLVVALLGSDTGVGVDAVVALIELFEKFGSDSGVGVDALVGLLGVLLGSDGGVGVESLFARLLGLADVGVGVDEVVALVTPPGFEPRQSAYDGYRCFMEQYVKNKLLGTLPWKLPDGTKW